MKRWIFAGTLIAVVDFLWACVLTYAYGSTFTALWTGVARVPFGARANPWLGILVHVCVAFFWAGVFLLLNDSIPALRRIPTLAVAIVYGPLIWIAMSLGVIPLFTHRMPTITYRWFIQLVGHMFFVGLPIVWGVRKDAATR